jgi:WD40 repeat protein/tRNA A-37 threonylcarbamoyl transferase component Bud32
MQADPPTNPVEDDPQFAAFVTRYQEALAAGRPLPSPECLTPQQRHRWEQMRPLLHLLHQTERPDAEPARLPALPTPPRLPNLGPVGQTVALAPDPAPGRSPRADLPAVPGYTVLAEVGRGGMGVVYQARHRALNRTVALKMVLAAELATPEQLLRFQLEAEMAARVVHPNVVQVHEIGRWQDRPFLALEWVEGGTLAQKLHAAPDRFAEPPLSVEEAARLVAVLARAVHAAHCQGVIHRDLKPANVLLAAAGVPKIADFGLAKPTSEARGLTLSGAVVGTPEYMAPEQASGVRQVGPAVDVYALGVILYECLTGQPPFRGPNLLETLQQVQQNEPVPPRSLEPRVPRDLDTICLKCLQKEPGKRYPTAEALADDLTRFLEGRPVVARPVGPAERGWRWVRRNPGVALLLACIVVALAGGSVVSTWFGLDARQQAITARYQEGLAEEARARAEKQKLAADLSTAEQTFQLGLQQAEAGAVDRGLLLMLRAWRQAPADAVSFPTMIRANLAGWSRQLPRLRQAVQVWKETDKAIPLAPRQEQPWGYQHIASGDDEGRTFLTWFQDRAARAFDSATGRPVALAPALADKIAYEVSADGRWLSVGGKSGYAAFDRDAGKEAAGVAALRYPFFPLSFADTADLAHAFKSGAEPCYCFWDLRTGEELPVRLRPAEGDAWLQTRTVAGRPVALVFHGLQKPGAGHEARVEAIDLASGNVLAPPLPLAGGPNPAVSYDGREALTEVNGFWQRLDLATGRLHQTPWRSRRRAGHSHLGRDGLEVLCGEIDHYLRSYDLTSGLQRGGDLLRGPQGRGSWGNGGSLWDDVRLFTIQGGPASSSGDGRLVFTVAGDGSARVWDTSLCRWQLTPATIPRRRVRSVSPYELEENQGSYSADGRRVVLTRRRQDHALLLDARSGDLLGPPLRQGLVELAAFSPDGRYLATAPCQGYNGGPDVTSLVVLRDGRTGQPLGRPWLSQKLIHALAFSPDGKTLAVGGVAGTFLLDVPAFGAGLPTTAVKVIQHLLETPFAFYAVPRPAGQNNGRGRAVCPGAPAASCWSPSSRSVATARTTAPPTAAAPAPPSAPHPTAAPARRPSARPRAATPPVPRARRGTPSPATPAAPSAPGPPPGGCPAPRWRCTAAGRTTTGTPSPSAGWRSACPG